MKSNQFLNVALVSQGGGTRGAFTSGVQDVLLQEGIRFSYIIGTSAGALNNINFLSEDVGRSKFVTTTLVGDRRFLSLHRFIWTGQLFNFHYLMKELPKELPFDEQRFKESPARFVCAATSLENGEATYFEKGVTPDIFAAVAASASLPLFSNPVEVEGQLYLDGGPTAAIPWRKAIEDGYQKIVVILTRPKDYRKGEPMNLFASALAKRQYRDYPNFLAAYLNYPACYNKDIEDLLELEKQGKAFIIAPKESLNVSNRESNPKKLIPIYELGVESMKELLPALREFLNE